MTPEELIKLAEARRRDRTSLAELIEAFKDWPADLPEVSGKQPRHSFRGGGESLRGTSARRATSPDGPKT